MLKELHGKLIMFGGFVSAPRSWEKTDAKTGAKIPRVSIKVEPRGAAPAEFSVDVKDQKGQFNALAQQFNEVRPDSEIVVVYVERSGVKDGKPWGPFPEPLAIMEAGDAENFARDIGIAELSPLVPPPLKK